MPRYGQIDRDYARRLATADPVTDGPVYMLNLMKYRKIADYEEDSGDTITGREADDRYAPVDVLRAIGARICFAADVVNASEDWDRVAVVRYPTRRSFIEMQSRRDFQEKHVHKEAGMDHTIIVGTVPESTMPPKASSDGFVLLELWDGSGPTPDGSGARFVVDGTILGDGRTWSFARFDAVKEGTPLPPGSDTHQALLLRPYVERWV